MRCKGEEKQTIRSVSFIRIKLGKWRNLFACHIFPRSTEERNKNEVIGWWATSPKVPKKVADELSQLPLKLQGCRLEASSTGWRLQWRLLDLDFVWEEISQYDCTKAKFSNPWCPPSSFAKVFSSNQTPTLTSFWTNGFWFTSGIRMPNCSSKVSNIVLGVPSGFLNKKSPRGWKMHIQS